MPGQENKKKALVELFIMDETHIDESDFKEEETKDKPVSSSWVSFLTLDYYQSYFDVSTSEVGERVLAGMVPVRSRLVDKLQPQPDLYGPFWLAVTLILVTAVCGNIANVVEKESNWEFHFHEVTLVGCCVYAYTWLVPFLLWSFLWWRGNRSRYTLLQLLAIYGYSISIFIPLVVLWLVRNEIVRWLLWALCTVSSGTVLVRSLWQPMSQESPRLATAVLVIVFVLHAALSTGFKMYYFSSSLSSSSADAFSTSSTGMDVRNGTRFH